MNAPRDLNEEEVMAWVRTPGNRILKYQIQSGPTSFVLLILVLSIAGAGVSYFIDWDHSDTMFGIALGMGVWTLIKLAGVFYTVGRKLVGISENELLLVENNSATLIPFESITDNGFTDAEKVSKMKDFIEIQAGGKSYKIKTMNLYFQLETLPDFLATLLDKTEEY